LAVAAVIGGAGRMGSWLVDFLSKNGYQVIVTDKNRPAAKRLARVHDFRYISDQTTAIQMAQLVVLATPTHITQRILQSLERDTSKDKLFIEISSIKEPLRPVLRDMKRRGLSVLSIHPLFGPGAETVRGRTILVMPLARRMLWADSFLRKLRRNGAKLVRCDINEHDKLMSLVLTLPHFLAIAFVNALKSLDADVNRLSKIAGPTFRLQLLLAEEVHHEGLDNEVSVLMDSPYSVATLKKAAQACNRMITMIARGNRRRMHRTLRAGRNYLQRDKLFSNAYSRFSEAVSAATLD